MKRMILITLLISVVAVTSYGQTEWGYLGNLGNAADSVAGNGHGIAVDGDGRIWYQPFGRTATVMMDTGATLVRAIFVFETDGTPVSFSPISSINVNGDIDTLFGQSRGLRTMPNGDVAAVLNDYTLYHIDRTTGAGVKKLTPNDTLALTAPAFTQDGDMVVGYVVGNEGVHSYDSDWEPIDWALPPGDLTRNYSRTIEVAKDGSAIYRTAYSSGWGFVRWNSSDGSIWGDFTGSSDSLARDLATGAVAWQPGTGYIWAGNGGGYGWGNTVHYAFDPANEFAMVDSIDIPAVLENDPGALPRGMAFNSTGTIAYLTFFDAPNQGIYKVEKGAVGVWEHTAIIVDGYALKANFPNPFNPSTNLKVVMENAGVVDLRVYDIRGAEVAVLNNSYLSAGEHTFTFRGKDLAAGIYVAKVLVNGAMYTQNMTLIK